MNRNSTRAGYQHDISIIGNLPQRLKKKIADKAKLDGLENFNAAADANNVKEEIKNAAGKTTAHVEAVPSVDFFLNYESKSKQAVPCNIGTAEQFEDVARDLDEVARTIPGILRLNGIKSENHISKMRASEDGSRTRKYDAAGATSAIPGIIRIDATEHVHMPSTFGKNGQRSRAAQLKVLKPKNVLDLNESPMNLLSVSPARSFAAKKYPPWFDDTQIESFSKDLKQLYDTFTGLMQQNAVQLLQHWLYFNNTRQQLLHIFEQLVLQHLKFCCEIKCDNFFWKLLFYNVRELLKFSNSALTDKQLIDLYEEGIAFYMNLIKCLKLKYLKSLPEASSRKQDKFEVIAKVVAQKLLINLGDLCRYKALHLKTNDLSEAASFYREAQILLPTNGIPYNQLAIVAIHDRKKFEAIYLHMRSLMSSNAIQSAKNSLLVLFDEIRKKFEKMEPKISPLHQYKQTSGNGNSSVNSKTISPMRKEVWIHPDGVRRLHRTNIDGRRCRLNKPAKNVEKRLDEMPNEELLHRFISIYLYMIGKLYTGIGMETIQAHQNKLLSQLSALLKKETSTILLSRSKIIKIATLNIFVLHHNIQQERREMRYYTFTFCNQVFGVLLQKCNQILATYSDEATTLDELEKCTSFKDLNTLLQFVKIYTDYLSLNVDIWEPVRKEEQYFIDPWLELQNLFDLLENADFLDTQHENKKNEVILEEDQFIYGFTPLSNIQTKYLNANQACDSEAKQFIHRISLIKAFGEIYTENAGRLRNEEADETANSSFVLEELDNDIKTALETLHKAAAAAAAGGNGDGDESEIEKSQASDESTIAEAASKPASTGNDQLAHLTKLKRELAHQTNAKRSYNAKLEEILSYVDTNVYIEVRPKYLMPDTNCFIDRLEDFERLIKNYKRYTLVIPLTVVRELDGLSKGIKADSRPHFMQKHRIHHFDDVSTCAKRSLDFIKNTKQQVKCVTSKGSIINASLFALVEDDYMSNDDRILATALALSKTMCLETSKDDKCLVQTQLVLITTDRNLRVKALSRNLAVSELDEFLLWARDCT